MQKTIKINPYGAFVQYCGIPLVAGDIHAYRLEGTFPDTEDLTGATVVVDAYRPDGEVVTSEGAIDGQTVYCVLPNNMYSVPGEMRVRLKVLGADASALTVVEIVLNALETEDADITGDDRYPILNQLIAQVNAAVSETGEMAQDISDLTASLTTHREAATLDHPDGSVTTDKLADGAVTTEKLASEAVTEAKLSSGVIAKIEKPWRYHSTVTQVADGETTTITLHPFADTGSPNEYNGATEVLLSMTLSTLPSGASNAKIRINGRANGMARVISSAALYSASKTMYVNGFYRLSAIQGIQGKGISEAEIYGAVDNQQYVSSVGWQKSVYAACDLGTMSSHELKIISISPTNQNQIVAFPADITVNVYVR